MSDGNRVSGEERSDVVSGEDDGPDALRAVVDLYVDAVAVASRIRSAVRSSGVQPSIREDDAVAGSDSAGGDTHSDRRPGAGGRRGADVLDERDRRGRVR